MDVFEVLQKDIDDQINMISESLAAGHAKDYAEYREMCGRIRGLRYAQQANDALARRLREGDDDD